MNLNFHSLNLTFYPSYHIDLSDLFNIVIKLYSRYKFLFSRGLQFKNDSADFSRSKMLEEPSLSDLETIEKIIRKSNEDLVCLTSSSDYVGIYKEDKNRKADLTLGYTLTAQTAFKYMLDFQLFRPSFAEFDVESIENVFIEIATITASYLGYCSVVRYPAESMYYHSPAQGPHRLEWLNWFGSCYEEVFNPKSFGDVPFQKVVNGSRHFYYLKTSENPNDYYGLRSYLSRYKYIRSIGADCFSVRPGWFNATRRDADRIPRYRDF